MVSIKDTKWYPMLLYFQFTFYRFRSTEAHWSDTILFYRQQQEKAAKAAKEANTEPVNQRELHNLDLPDLDFK